MSHTREALIMMSEKRLEEMRERFFAALSEKASEKLEEMKAAGIGMNVGAGLAGNSDNPERPSERPGAKMRAPEPILPNDNTGSTFESLRNKLKLLEAKKMISTESDEKVDLYVKKLTDSLGTDDFDKHHSELSNDVSMSQEHVRKVAHGFWGFSNGMPPSMSRNNLLQRIKYRDYKLKDGERASASIGRPITSEPEKVEASEKKGFFARLFNKEDINESYPSNPNISKEIRNNIARGMTQEVAMMPPYQHAEAQCQ